MCVGVCALGAVGAGMLFGAASPVSASKDECVLVCFSTLQGDTAYVYPGGVVGFCVKGRLEGDLCAGDERVRLAMIARPSFLQPVGHTTSRPGLWAELCVIQRISGKVCPATYWAKFECKNESTGETVMHSVRIKVLSHKHGPKCGCGRVPS